jgi:ribose transport system ATP-binding protein
VHELVRAAIRAGAAAVIASSDFAELAALSDRVLVLVRGRAVDELHGPGLDARRLERAAYRSGGSP